MSEFTDVVKGVKPTLVDFFATWCGPCKMQGPVLEQVKNKFGDSVNVIKVDVDKNPQLSQEYRVQSVPTLILFKNGEVVWRASGLHQAVQLEEVLNKHVAV